ncbi:MAG: EthD domain-containing protein [Actinobacteria bacterium]|nr:EthD domain-containing protein [Actinomycetota bacterium]MDA8186391.1 EthD domain-containing protein [Actinomycetota bacterium]
MVRLVCFLKRKPGMSTEEFHSYWRDHHGPLVMSTRSGSYVRRYVQFHRSHSGVPDQQEAEYDGVTEQWFDSIESYFKSISESDYRVIAADLSNFLDVGKLVFTLVEDDGEPVDAPAPEVRGQRGSSS